MATKKLGRLIHFANFPLRMLMPKSRENIKEIAFKTVPSASKVIYKLASCTVEQIEIKRVLESLYGLEVERVNTLNMEGKKKLNRKSTRFYRRPDYKKAYVVLKNPVSLPANLFPLNVMEETQKSK